MDENATHANEDKSKAKARAGGRQDSDRAYAYEMDRRVDTLAIT